MSALTAGGTDWVSNIITSIRLDFGNTSGGVFDVDWIAIGRLGPSASSKAVESLSSTVTQQGNKLTAESQRIDGLYASVGDANAAIQNEATARSDGDTALGRRVDTVQSNLGATNATVQQISTAQTALNGKVNATWSVKLGLTSGGTYYAAGFGLGLENQGGTFQSSFVVLANRFAVMNPVGEGLISPFAVQNGQVFISDALISNLAVQKAIVGNSINSSELANDGTPIMRMDFASGTIIMLNKSATAYTVFNRSGIDMVINGVRRIRMGEW
nr:phage tail protein [Pseudomonas putida]